MNLDTAGNPIDGGYTYITTRDLSKDEYTYVTTEGKAKEGDPFGHDYEELAIRVSEEFLLEEKSAKF